MEFHKKKNLFHLAFILNAFPLRKAFYAYIVSGEDVLANYSTSQKESYIKKLAQAISTKSNDFIFNRVRSGNYSLQIEKQCPPC